MQVARSCLVLGAAALACAVGAETRQLDRPDANLMDELQFFVCDSQIDGMDGKYVLQSGDASTRSDPSTPVYFREDEGDEQEHDFRLFRHRGFWMFADVGAWPPETHFRCDPTKHKLVPQTLALSVVCQVNLPTPPSMGYSPALSSHSVAHLELSRSACPSKLPTLEHADDDMHTLSSRISEL